MKSSKQILMLALGFWGMALADETAQLRPEPKAVIFLHEELLTLEAPRAIVLAPGDRLCVREGQLKVVQTGKSERSLQAGECLQTTARSAGKSLLGFVAEMFKPKPRTTTSPSLQSRGDQCDPSTTPTLHIPRDLALSEVLFPTLGRPNPKTIRLYDRTGKVYWSLETPLDRAVMVLPTQELNKASRLEVINARGDVLYAGDVYRVELLEPVPQDFREAALFYLATGLPEYAPLAYTYLRNAGDAETAKVLEDQIRLTFACGS